MSAPEFNPARVPRARTGIADGRVAQLPRLRFELTDVYVATFLGYDEVWRREQGGVG